MQDMVNILENSPANDKKLLYKILDKLKGNQILIFLFYLMAISLLAWLLFVNVSLINAIVMITIIICFTAIIIFTLHISKKSKGNST